MMQRLAAPFKVEHSQNKKAWKGEQCRSKRRVHPSVDHGGTCCWPMDGGEEDGRNERTKLIPGKYLVFWICAAEYQVTTF